MEDNKKEVKVESVSVEDSKPEISNDKQTEIIEQLNNKIAELNDKYLRVAAELENTRRRSALDIESVSRNRAMSVAEKILPVMDAVQSALKHAPDDEGIKTMEQFYKNIGDTKADIVLISDKNYYISPKFEGFAAQTDVTLNALEETETNTIVEEMQTGYMFGDTVLRTAMVVVSK